MMPRRHNSHLVHLSIFALVLMVMPAGLFAAGVGQIKGQIVDKETGEPVLQASVLVVGTKSGAMTDFDGRYIISRLEPGTYAIRISHLDYLTVEVTGIEVKTDHTTEQDQAMEKKVTELDETITVTAVRDVIDRFETDNRKVISQEVIERAPVTSVDELLGQVSGVIADNTGEIFIRGGRAGEVAYIVDGVPIGDPLGGLGQAGANLSLVSGSIQEFTVIKDGFDPEYGDALSGIVKITTQTGSKDNTQVNLHYMTDDLGNSTMNKYSRNYDYVRFKLSGPDPILRSRVLPALGLNFLEDKEFTYFFYAEVSKDDGVHQYEDYDTPTITRNFNSFNLLGLDIPERLNNRYYWTLNLKFRPKQNLKFIFSYKDSKDRWTSFNWNYRYSPNTAPVLQQDWRSISLEVSQTIRRNMSYEALFSYAMNSISQKPGDPTNPGKGLNPDDFVLNSEWESYDDNNDNGVYDAPEPIINLFPDTAEYGFGFSGPAYTAGEWTYNMATGQWERLRDVNAQAGENYISDFRFNDNGIYDNLEGEPFIDLNGNGVWDAGDFLHDQNGNGILDQARIKNVDTREPEPFVDGDSIIGEDFVDLNGNNTYDEGVDIFVMSAGPDNMDINDNGKYDGPNDIWQPGIPYLDRNGNGIYDYPNAQYELGEPFTDVNGNGVYDDGGSKNFLSPNNHLENALWHFHSTDTYRGELKTFWQLGSHELKGGFSIQKDYLKFREIEQPYYPYNSRSDGGPYPDRGAFRDMFDYEPWKGTVYFRDKLEYGSMIASLGFRWDFFIQDRYNLVDVARQDDLGSGVIYGDRQKFSPRIGFSYPISDKAKIHFNYGHFYQLPSLLNMYQRNTVSVDRNAVIGNYNLDYQKTVQYSFGVKYAMNENYSVDVSGYFKDEFDKVNSMEVLVGGMTFQQYQNSDYGRSRGFELQIEKRGGGYVNGSVNYTYAFAFGKASEANQNYLGNEELNRQPLSEAPLDNDIRHRLQANVQFFVPNTVKPRLFGVPIPNGWSLAIETLIESGRPFTPDRSYPNLAQITGEDIQRNVLRKPSTIVFDLRFTKDFKFVGMDYSFIVWVENVFDSRNVVYVYPATGRPDTQRNQNQIVKGGTAYDLNPSNWDYGRQIRLGIEVNL
ncbi:MAG: carboxypeptidase-like regulatory domain-containing protein [bacterium]